MATDYPYHGSCTQSINIGTNVVYEAIHCDVSFMHHPEGDDGTIEIESIKYNGIEIIKVVPAVVITSLEETIKELEDMR